MEEKSVFDCIQSLKKHGLQVTHQRLAIYLALRELTEHPSAEIIYRQVRKRFPMISLGTVYKTLERLHEVGLVQKVGPIMDETRYEATPSSHHHLVCIKCQALEDVDGLSDELGLKPPDDKGFHILGHHITFRGYCPSCRDKDEA